MRSQPGAPEAGWIIDWLQRNGFDALLGIGPFGIMWWQWIVLLAALVFAWVGGRILGRLTSAALHRVSTHTTTSWDGRLFVSLGPPIRLAWLLILFALIAHSIGLSGAAENVIRQAGQGFAVATIFWALWRSTTVILQLMLSRPWAIGNPSTRNLLAIGGNLSKGLIAVVGVLALLAALGYPVTTLLAGLGIGGLAFAFGAQKTVENLFGSMAIAVDQPFRVGDLVRVGDFTGTVEDIGLRSTRIRTVTRTLVTIPNAQFSTMAIENLSVRDRIPVRATLALPQGTTAARVREVLAKLRERVSAVPHVDGASTRATFVRLESQALDVELFVYAMATSWDEYIEVREQVLLAALEALGEQGRVAADGA